MKNKKSVFAGMVLAGVLALESGMCVWGAGTETGTGTETNTETNTGKEVSKTLGFLSVGKNSTSYAKMPEYEKYTGVIADTRGNYLDVSMALYDIDNDGTRELILSYGTCSADWTNDIYTIEEGDAVTMIGTLGSSLMFYTAPDGNGIYTVYGKMGYQSIERVTKVGKELKEESIENRQIGDNEDYTSYDRPIELLSVDEVSGNSYTEDDTDDTVADSGEEQYLYEVVVSAPDGGVNIRSGAGVEYAKVRENMIPTGVTLRIYSETLANTGRTWGYTTYDGVSGWIALSQVTRIQ